MRGGESIAKNIPLSEYMSGFFLLHLRNASEQNSVHAPSLISLSNGNTAI